MLITNCDRFADVVKQRTGFYAITGNDLDKLQPWDFAVIRAWLEGARIEPQPKNPLPHQAQAIDNLLSALREHDRATALMACGTGKTLVALWVAERMGVQNILVLVPSLALLRQTLHEWARETSWQSLAHLCVCSDPTVKPGSDELVLRPTDLDFPVSTDSAQVRAFLAAQFDGVKLVFSTYQSAHVVAAGMKRDNGFDLAIFDEAHKTAGREGVHFGFALNDKNLAIKKRLFVTATPRHYDVRKRDKEGDARIVYSMDAPEVYGPVAHKLTFAEAARRGIICAYKVIISVVTSDMVNDRLLRHGEVIVKGDAVKARHVASQLALQAAVAQHGVRKIFTFHRSVASAAAFTSGGSEGIGNHLSGFDASHVNGSMPTSERENIMTEFRAASKAVISNAKCLTEGVDVPAVDMVAFLTPKRSRVDIVQATGRAMRKAGGKTTGYVLVPLFVEQAKGETIEQALARTEFDEVWNVLQAMQEQDDMLAEIIRQMREERGRTKGFDDARFSEKVEFLGPQISLEALRDSITTACIKALGDNWDERFGQLKAFKEQHGHCNVPKRAASFRSLGVWIIDQRTLRRRGELTEERIQRLSTLGFEWNPSDAVWEKNFASLSKYKAEFGDCNVPARWPEVRELGGWVSEQRKFKKRGILSDERISKLEEIGFVWDPTDAAWEHHLSALQQYKAKHGDCDVPLRSREDADLGVWVNAQRSRRRQGKVSQERIEQLTQLGFEWNPVGSIWEKRFKELLEYKQRHGNCNVPAQWKQNRALGRWVASQRSLNLEKQLSAERVRRLGEIGFEWAPIDADWDEHFAELEEYQKRFGDCDVPAEYTANPVLGRWISMQRRRRKTGKLADARVRLLSELGLKWDMKESAWERFFAELLTYKKKHGDCNVPQRYTGQSGLGMWVNHQRRFKKRGKLSKQCIRRLNSVGFEWAGWSVGRNRLKNQWDARWNEMLTELIAFRTKCGHCNVTKRYSANPDLGKWVQMQRRANSLGKLEPQRIALLNGIGFRWKIRAHGTRT